MKDCDARTKIDSEIMKQIEETLVSFGVEPERAYECYDRIRFQAEGRAVLLNRVQDRKMPTEGIRFYGAFLDEIADKVGVQYDPDQPV